MSSSQVKIRRVKGILNTSRYIVYYKNLCVMSQCIIHRDYEPDFSLNSIYEAQIKLHHFIRMQYHRDTARIIIMALKQFYNTKEEFNERQKLSKAITGCGISLHAIP